MGLFLRACRRPESLLMLMAFFSATLVSQNLGIIIMPGPEYEAAKGDY
jgi:hypothetical protein